MSGSEGGVGDSQDKRSQSPNRSPNRSFAHRAIMGGAAELPQRSSSPMKRRASDFEQDESVHHKEDVDMEAPPKDESLDDMPDLERIAVQEVDSGSSVSPERMISDTGDIISGSGTLPRPGKAGRTSRQPAEELPPIDEQIKLVTEMCEAQAAAELGPGETVYLISNKWLSKVQARGTGAKSRPEDIQGDIGPIDNSDIVQETITDHDGLHFARLRPELPRDAYTLFPENAWNYVVKLYGLPKGAAPIVRIAHNTNPDQTGMPNIQYEMYPPILTVHRLWSAHSPIPISQILKAKNPLAPVFVMGRGDRYVELLRKIKKAADIDLIRKVRVWRIPQSLTAGGETELTSNELSPPPSRPVSPAPNAQERSSPWANLLVEVDSFLKLQKGTQRELVQTPDHSSNANYNGSMTIEMADLGADQALVIDEIVDKDAYISNYVAAKDSGSVPISSVRNNKTQSDSGRSSPAPSSAMITRGRTQKTGRTIGAVGLSNLGNTCYMNSALQCVRSVEELTKYFLADVAEEELNPDNPLGNNGDVARVYGGLLHEMFREPPPISVSPRQFKNTIGRYAPSFSGYGQQDSQEFLGFLLDGLQEDLSRVKKKPYIEKPDSTDEMVGNAEAIKEMAAKVWDITKKRDDSVIADLFTGMYKSTLVCPVCDKVSITFDPFNNLTLQLPIENVWTHDVFYFPLNAPPLRVTVDMDKNGSIKALKQFISKRVDVPVERLFIAEEWKCRFYKFYDETKTVSDEISSNDRVAVYELDAAPTNWPAPKKVVKQKVRSMLNFNTYNNESDDEDVPSWDDPMSQTMVIPVLHRVPVREDRPARFSNRKKYEHIACPHFITLTPQEARNEAAIRRKILEKVGTFTTHPGFNVSDNEDIEESTDSIDPDLVVTTASDADSSGDSGKVVASSIDGEDDVVDVTMKDSNSVRESIEKDIDTTNSPQGKTADSRKRKLGGRRPKWIDPAVYLPPEFQNMFEMGYFSGAKEQVPAGWGAVDEDKEFPRLASRDPKTSETPDEAEADTTMGTANSPSDVGSDEANEADALQPATTRMNEESSDEDEIIPNNNTTRALPVRPVVQKVGGVRVGNARRRNRGIKTYSKKASKPEIAQEIEVAASLEDALDEGPLVRLGEGIVVDWNRDAWDAVYNGDPDDEMRGRATFSQIEFLEDPELEVKRKARLQRRKNGLTLDECLDEFGKEEVLSEMDMWYCPRCKEHRRATKKFELWKTPDILVMHLKRFSSGAFRRDKLDVEVDYPIEGLDLTSRVMEHQDGKSEIYDLFAVDLHWGGLGGGHYTAFAKSFFDGEWYEYNDASVRKQRDLSQLVTSGAYLLFYRRRSSVPLGGPRFQEIFNRYDSKNQPEEESESGEDQRLAADSSLHGSSSALIGVGAAHQVGGSDGAQRSNDTNIGKQQTIDPSALERLPPYQQHMDEDDGAPLLSRDAAASDGIPIVADDDDEGIDMSDGLNYNNLSNPINQKWSWGDIGLGSSKIAAPSGADSEATCNESLNIDGRSDIVQNNSSASETSLSRRKIDFETAEVDPDEWEEPAPIPDLPDDERVPLDELHGDLRAAIFARGFNRDDMVGEINFRPDMEDDEVEEPATDIHVDDDEAVKMD